MEMAQRAKTLAAKPSDLSSISRTHIIEVESQPPSPQKKLPLTATHTMACVPHCDPNYRDPFGLADGRTILLSIGLLVNGTPNNPGSVCLSSILQYLGSYALVLDCSKYLASWSILVTKRLPHKPWWNRLHPHHSTVPFGKSVEADCKARSDTG